MYIQKLFTDELEREEFYRLKKVQDKKKKIRKMKEEQAAERRAAGLDEGDGGDIFEEEHDEDLLFQRKAWKIKMILCD